MAAPAARASSPERSWPWLVRAAVGVPMVLGLSGATAWGTLAIYYAGPGSAALRIALAALFAILGAASLVLLGWRGWRWRALGAFALVFVALLGWWSGIRPSNDRNWKPEVAVLPYATVDGDRVTIHNIRNFNYRNETDFTPAYYDRTFDLRKLESVDLIASYWAGPAIAHIFLSFGFADGTDDGRDAGGRATQGAVAGARAARRNGSPTRFARSSCQRMSRDCGFGANDHVAISIERRDERHEGYSAIKGMFRQYELFYVVADERDVIRVRTNYRRDPPERVYLYRLQGSPESARRVFEEYLREINSLRERPQFYHTLTANCTGNIWLHARINPGHVPYSWKVLVSGHLPEYLYEQGRLDTRVPFEELRRRGHINALAQAADRAPDFSRRIRANLAAPPTEVSR